MDGIILIDKEKGPTSFAVIDVLKRKFRLKKIGHGGTLDPAGEGLLIALINKGTKLNDFLPSEKEYDIDITFGIQTDTDDTQGSIIDKKPVPGGLPAIIEGLIPSFTGEIMQTPPAYSALKKNGEKLCDLARKGEAVEPEPRRAVINEIALLSSGEDTAKLRVVCESGTYMRSLARDMGIAAGSCAVLSRLKRTRIGGFTVNDARPISAIASIEECIIPVRAALAHIPEYELTEKQAELIKNGHSINDQACTLRGLVKLVFNGEVTAVASVFGGIIKIRRGI